MDSRHAQQRQAPSTANGRCLPHSHVCSAAQRLSSATAGAGELRLSGESYAAVAPSSASLYAGAACKQLIHTAKLSTYISTDNAFSYLAVYARTSAKRILAQLTLPVWVHTLSKLPYLWRRSQAVQVVPQLEE